MNQRYQRACEIVGCHETPWNGGSISPGDFSLKAIQWLGTYDARDVCCGSSGDKWYVFIGLSNFSAPTLTEALTEAVLAVEDEE